MTAIACLKVFVGEDAVETETDAALVARTAGEYLRSAWLAPRRHGLVAPFSFVLADPRAVRLDAVELQALAQALQQKLFGAGDGGGEIVMLMFEGDQREVMRFAGLPARQLSLLLAGEEDASLAGRVCRITPREVRSIMPAGGTVTGAPAPAAIWGEGCPVWRGVYHVGRQLFIGGAAVWREAGQAHETYIDGARAEADICLLKAAAETAGPQSAMIFLPIGFSSVLKPALRAALEPHLRALPREGRGRLTAVVYGVPRVPSLSALAQVKAFLDPHFSRLDLRICDPDFQVEDMPVSLAASVTFAPQDGPEPVRIAAIGRFLRASRAYRRRQLWQGVSDLRSPRELAAALDLGAPFLSGPMVTDLLDVPGPATHCARDQLPLHGWPSAVDAA